MTLIEPVWFDQDVRELLPNDSEQSIAFLV